MKWNNVILGMGLLIIAGCGGSAAPTGPNLGAYAPVTVLTTCTGSTPAGTTIIGTWSAEFSDPQGDLQIYNFDFQANTLALTVTCQYVSGLTMQAPVTASIQMSSNNSIIIPLTETYDAPPKLDPTGAERTCNAVIPQGTMVYSFQGPCLTLNQAGEPSVQLVKQSSN